jgi:hypothetical protein
VKLLVLALLVASTGCALLAPLDCDDRDWEPGGLTCASVDAAAQAALGDVGGIVRLSAAYTPDCPHASQCPPAWGTVTVTAEVTSGPSIHLLVWISNDGRIRTERLPAVPAVP